MQLDEYSIYLTPLLIMIGAALFGLIFEKIAFKYLYRFAERTKWEGDSIIVESLRGKIVYLSIISGLYVAAGYLLLGIEVLSLIHRGLVVALILLVTMASARVSVGFVDLYTKEALPSTSLLTHSTNVVVYVVGLLVILQYLNISIAPMLAALGIGGLAVALALQDTLSNLFSGLHILAARQTKKGDYIKLDSGEEGYVEDVTWRNTIVRALPNNFIVIPNTKMAAAIITNYNRPQKEMSVLVQVGVGYGSDLEKVERVTIETATEVMREEAGGVPEFEPFIRYHTFGESSINFTVIIRAREFVDQYLIKHKFVKKLQKCYVREGIEIPFPIRTVHLQKQEK